MIIGNMALTKIQLIAITIVLSILIATGLYIKHLYDFKSETIIKEKLYEERRKAEEKRHDKDKIIIMQYYENKEQNVSNFTKGKDETDYNATRRFFNSVGYGR